MENATASRTAALTRNRKEDSEVLRAQQRDSHSAGSVHPPQHAVVGLQKTVGNRAVQRMLARHIQQPKLNAVAADPIHEKEADPVAAEATVAHTSFAAAGASSSGDDHSQSRSSANGASSHRLARQELLRGMPIHTLQQDLGNRALARLFQPTPPAPAVAELSRACECGGESKEKDAEGDKNRPALQRSAINEDKARETPILDQVHATPAFASGPVSVQRACLPAASCAAPPGSASVFGAQATSAEAAARARRAAMSPARQVATGHTGHARALESFLNSQTPGLLANIHGIFIDQDMAATVEASTQPCDSMTPPIRGATKPCVFVHGHLNQEALTFNTKPAATTIGGQPREDWRIQTLQTLTHEVQHVRYDTALGGAAPPAGVTCARADVESELSELNAILSEFPMVFDAVPAGASAADPAQVRLDNWFNNAVSNSGESIQGTLHAIDCKCLCPETDAYVKETVAFVTSAWPAARKNALNVKLRAAIVAPLRWPL